VSQVRLIWLADVLRAEGCLVKTYEGWKERSRPTGDFHPFGVLWHHTGTPTTMERPAPSVGTCINGRSDLPGPLCQVVIGRDGICHVIAAGRANHAGTNDGTGTGPIPAGDGNAQMVGFEIDYSGSQDMGPLQMQAAIKASAAVLRKLGKDHTFARGHKETSTSGKWDPGRRGSSSPEYLMGNIREEIRKALIPPKQKVRYVLMDGDGRAITTSTAFVPGPNETTVLVSWFTRQASKALRELRADGDISVRRVKQ
jgi:hypothetical protein